jgi:hypothetical protein
MSGNCGCPDCRFDRERAICPNLEHENRMERERQMLISALRDLYAANLALSDVDYPTSVMVQAFNALVASGAIKLGEAKP